MLTPRAPDANSDGVYLSDSSNELSSVDSERTLDRNMDFCTIASAFSFELSSFFRLSIILFNVPLLRSMIQFCL